MSLTYSQNWDGVTAPAIPSGWNVDAALVTSTTQASSGPNSLGLTGGSAATRYFGTYGTDDGSGSATVAISLTGTVKLTNAGGSTGNYWGGVTFRGSGSTLNFVNTTFYELYIKSNEHLTIWGLVLAKVVNGVETVLATATINASLGTTSWYQVGLNFVGGGAATNSIQATLQRLSDGFWLNGAGNFQSSAAVPLASSNNDITTGGYAGYTGFYASASGTVWLDDWAINSGPPVTFSPYVYRLNPVPRPDNTPYWS